MQTETDARRSLRVPAPHSFKLSIVLVGVLLLFSNEAVLASDAIPDEILRVFENKCAYAGCHVGSAPAADLSLSEESAFDALVNQPSLDFPNIPLVKPGAPLKSYLMMKMVGTSGIKGRRMPIEEPLQKTELRAIAAWIKSLGSNGSQTPAPRQKYAATFPGFSSATLQTTETLARGSFLYRIAHRWLGKVDSGFDQFFGLDAGAHLLTQFAFPLRDNLTLSVGRSGTNATFGFETKWRLFREKTDGSVPFSATLFGGVDWLTLKALPDPQNPGQNLSRSSGERFQWYGQFILAKKLSQRFAVQLSPGFLVNGNVTVVNEEPIITLGLIGRMALSKKLAVFVEGAPILSGSSGALPVGGSTNVNGRPVVYDSFTLGLEHHLGGHVFHLYITNSLGLTTAQVMSGGNLSFSDGDFRLGFNIYRSLGLP